MINGESVENGLHRNKNPDCQKYVCSSGEAAGMMRVGLGTNKNKRLGHNGLTPVFLFSTLFLPQIVFLPFYPLKNTHPPGGVIIPLSWEEIS